MTFGSANSRSVIQVMPHTQHCLYACTVQQLDDLVSLFLQCVRFDISRLVGTTVTEKVWRKHAVPSAGEVLKLASPVIRGGGETVQEENGWLVGLARSIVHIAVSMAGRQLCGANVRKVVDSN